MNIAIMSVGIPGSGKTTVLRSVAEFLDAAYVCPDDIRAELSGGDPTNHEHERDVWELARVRSVQALEAGQHVVIDATFIRPADRTAFTELLRDNGATQIIGAYADIPLNVALERNRNRDRVVPEHIITTRHELLTKNPPSIDEGFDAIVPLEKLIEVLTRDA